jgi:hypothetical protein
MPAGYLAIFRIFFKFWKELWGIVMLLPRRGPYFSDHDDDKDSSNHCRPRGGVRYPGSCL